MKNLTRQDWIMLVLVFILILVSASLFGLVDETTAEGNLSWYLRLIMFIGIFLSVIISAPIISVINLINGNGQAISYSAYFSVLPFLTAFVYTAILGVFVSRLRKKKDTDTN